MTRKVLMLMVLALFMCMGVGCCPITRLNISIQLDKSFQEKYGSNREILVDVVGVKSVEDDQWMNFSMTKYWANPNDNSGQRNTELRKTLTFNSKSLDPQVVSPNDPKWDMWLKDSSDKHPPQIYILVQMPGVHDEKDDKVGAQDPRRLILTTKSCEIHRGMFDPPPTVQVVITADRVRLQ